MQLTSLEIKGFKSFADKQIIHFNHNVTGIVGPNGCGKSNVVDAIRWVLGEQRSRALRSEKMDNLIFNGNKIRKASGRAEVNLTFENTRNLLPTEYQTVTISRVLYRNGDSEYRLNNVTCRLKDIQALFMDTGISSDSYAIIELNMISEILMTATTSAENCLSRLPEFLNIKFAKETSAKLEGTSSDLNVEDLLAEIENNLKTLEKQAKRAEKYKKFVLNTKTKA
ncbi:MAG: AAA family ATPase [Chitinophagales bacterium]|nr:AAA family ATPase [Chitinophagales bacterium]